jgi:hypothetical protein
MGPLSIRFILLDELKRKADITFMESTVVNVLNEDGQLLAPDTAVNICKNFLIYWREVSERDIPFCVAAIDKVEKLLGLNMLLLEQRKLEQRKSYYRFHEMTTNTICKLVSNLIYVPECKSCINRARVFTETLIILLRCHHNKECGDESLMRTSEKAREKALQLLDMLDMLEILESDAGGE